MSLKKLGVALIVVFVLGAITANGAFAENSFTEPGSTWTVAGAPLAQNVHKALKTAAVGKQSLKTTVGGITLDITATGVECIECFIDNTPTTTATIDGTLKYTGVTMSEPASCTVRGGTITTKPLTAVVGMGAINANRDLLKFKPVSGTTLAVFELNGPGCSISGTYKVTGTQFAESVNNTNITTVDQELVMSEAIQKQAGTAGSLKFGENAAILSGTIDGTLVSGETFGSAE
jgi:hypothetical protein